MSDTKKTLTITVTGSPGVDTTKVSALVYLFLRNGGVMPALSNLETEWKLMQLGADGYTLQKELTKMVEEDKVQFTLTDAPVKE